MDLFSPIEVGSTTFQNRTVMAPMVTNNAGSDGVVTEEFKNFYRARAQGGVGYIVLGGAYVQADGKGFQGQLGIDRDESIPGLSDLAATLGRHCRVGVQLSYKSVGRPPETFDRSTIHEIRRAFITAAKLQRIFALTAHTLTLFFLVILTVQGIKILPTLIFGGIDSFPLMAIPFFIMAGDMMSRSGVLPNLVKLADSIVGHLKGGLAYVNILASMFFAGVTGVAVADTAAVGSMLVPAMKAVVPDADGIFIACTNFRCSDVIEQIEEDSGKPVVTSNQATAWHLMKLLGMNDVVEGYGQLLRKTPRC